MKAKGDSHQPKRGRRVLVVAALPLILIAWFALVDREPRYNDVPVSEYVRSVLSNNMMSVTAITNELAPLSRAVSITAITSVLAQEDASLKHIYQELFPRMPLWLRRGRTPPRFDQQIIASCVMTLGAYGPEAKPAVPTLIRSLELGNDYVKLGIANTLSRIGPDASAAVPALITTALTPGKRSLSADSRAAAVRAVANIDQKGDRSAKRLQPLLAESDAKIVAAVVGALGRMAKRSPSLAPQLRASLDPFIEQLKSSNTNHRAFSATVLMHAQLFAADIIPGLIQLAPETNGIVREAAVNSLAIHAYDNTVPHRYRVSAAKAVLKYGSPETAWRMLAWLPQFRTEPGETVHLLMTALDSESERVRGQAARNLGERDVPATEALRALQRSCTDDWINVREAATNAIRAIESRTR